MHEDCMKTSIHYSRSLAVFVLALPNSVSSFVPPANDYILREDWRPTRPLKNQSIQQKEAGKEEDDESSSS
ncbi:unnamed protein product [Arctia plantaginis]|uniref:Uncharacterized protein n=1 Tax=Arctia plantaginis TaxID=874455 RepID=A0A8S1A9K8_ARCPL|nr:unnamed protein product [Arctia plantaginis]